MLQYTVYRRLTVQEKWSPDDELPESSKHVENEWRLPLKIKDSPQVTSCWLFLNNYNDARNNECNILKGKHRGKLTKGVFFLHDNAPAHRALATRKKLAHLGVHCLDHPPYSPDLAPSDYHLFPGLKKPIESSPFFFQNESRRCRGDLIERKPSECFSEWLAEFRATG